MNLPTYFNTKEAADYLGVSATYLAYKRVAGGGPLFTKLGSGRTSVVRYLRDDLDAWMAQHKVASTSCVQPSPSPHSAC